MIAQIVPLLLFKAVRQSPRPLVFVPNHYCYQVVQVVFSFIIME